MALDPDEEALRPKPPVVNLQVMSIAELEARIATLEAEIAAARAMIESKRAIRGGADALFKR